MNSMKDLWDSVLKRLSHELSETTINTWFDEVTVVTMEDSAFVLHCSNTFKKSTIEARFLPHIKAALRDLFSTDLEVKILDDQQLAAYHGVAPDRPGDLSESEAFTFETYVVGPQNKLAFAAAKAVTEKPGENYNPLFIYGDSGLGKTHMMQAIGNYYTENYPDKKVLYTTSEKFTYELVTAIREKTNQAFRNKYRNVDLLLIDDIQFFANKEMAQEEFFHTFYKLQQESKQIVITSDKPPKALITLEERLRTRFEGGLIADISAPDYETRLAIINRKSELLELKIPNEVAEFMANRLKSNIRQLEPFEPKIYHEKEEEFYTTPGQFEPVERYRSPWERWYKAETGKGELVKIYTDIKYDVPAGKYLLSIKGYVRKEKQKYPVPNCGFYLSLTKVEAFEGFKNPREADEYNFNIGSME